MIPPKCNTSQHRRAINFMKKGVCFVSMRQTMMAKLDKRILWSASVGRICFTQIALMSGSSGLSGSCDVSNLSRTAHMLK